MQATSQWLQQWDAASENNSWGPYSARTSRTDPLQTVPAKSSVSWSCLVQRTHISPSVIFCSRPGFRVNWTVWRTVYLSRAGEINSGQDAPSFSTLIFRDFSMTKKMKIHDLSVQYIFPSAKCMRPLFQGRTGCGGRPSGWHDIVTRQRLVSSATTQVNTSISQCQCRCRSSHPGC